MVFNVIMLQHSFNKPSQCAELDAKDFGNLGFGDTF